MAIDPTRLTRSVPTAEVLGIVVGVAVSAAVVGGVVVATVVVGIGGG
jgi:hypothetical protein